MPEIWVRYRGQVCKTQIFEESSLQTVFDNVSQFYKVNKNDIILLRRGRKYTFVDEIAVDTILYGELRAECIMQLAATHWRGCDIEKWINDSTDIVTGFVAEIPKRKKQLKLDYDANALRLTSIEAELSKIEKEVDELSFTSDSIQSLKLQLSAAFSVLRK